MKVTRAQTDSAPRNTPFPTERWYVAGFSWELQDKPVGRTLLNRPMMDVGPNRARQVITNLLKSQAAPRG